MTEPKVVNEKAASALRSKIRDIVERHAQASTDVCWALYETYHCLVRIGGQDVPIWSAWGYSSWHDFVGIELGLHQTTAYCYKKVWEVFYVKLGGAWEASSLLPITKMRILSAAKLDKRNVNAWMKKAKRMTCAQLVSAVYGTDELHTFATTLSKGDLDTLNRVIDEARSAFGPDRPRGEVLVRLAEEWQTMFRNTTKTRDRLRLVG